MSPAILLTVPTSSAEQIEGSLSFANAASLNGEFVERQHDRRRGLARRRKMDELLQIRLDTGKTAYVLIHRLFVASNITLVPSLSVNF